MDVIARAVRVEKVGPPPYSPDGSPCDFDLFPKLKESMRGIRYKDLEELESAVAARARVLENGCLATGIDDLPEEVGPSLTTRDITLKECRTVTTLNIYYGYYLIGCIIYWMTLVYTHEKRV